MSLMWFFDEIPEEYRAFRREAQALEREYLELRVLLRDTQAALRSEADDENLKAKERYLCKRLAELEQKAPYLAEDILKEFALYGVPH